VGIISELIGSWLPLYHNQEHHTDNGEHSECLFLTIPYFRLPHQKPFAADSEECHQPHQQARRQRNHGDGDPKEITDAIKSCEVGDVYQVVIFGLSTFPDWRPCTRNSENRLLPGSMRALAYVNHRGFYPSLRHFSS
jgi:hypothetical protein